MSWYTGSRRFTATLSDPRKKRRVRAIAAGTATGLVLTLAQVPIVTASAPAATVTDLDPTGGQPAEPTAADLELRAAVERARETGDRVELVSRRAATQTYWMNPDGTTTAEITQFPTRVRQNGTWNEISTDLQKSDVDGVLETEATKAGVEIAAGGAGSEAPVAEVSSGAKSLALDWPTDLPKATVDGPEANFDAGSKNVQVTATERGFNFRIILDKAPLTAPVYRLPVTTTGVGRLSEAGNGGFVAKDAEGTVTFRIDPAVMWDHSQDGLEAGPEQTVPVDAKLTENADGQQVLELRPDFAWLSDSSRMYPVTVDPDVYLDAENPAAPNNQGDTFVRQNAETTDFGGGARVDAGYHASYGKARSLIWHQLPTNHSGTGEVVEAKLRLYQWDAGSCDPTLISAVPATSSWSVHTTWSTHTRLTNPEAAYNVNSPYKATATFAHGKESCGGTGTTGPNAFDEIDVKAMVDQWMRYKLDADPNTAGNQTVGVRNLGMVLFASDTSTAAFKSFCSMNVDVTNTACDVGSKQPTLNITYNTPPSIVHDTSTSPSTCATGEFPLVPSLSPTLRGTADDVDIWKQGTTDPAPVQDGQEQLRIDFEVWPQDAAEIDDPSTPGDELVTTLADPSDPSFGPAVSIVATGSVKINQGVAAAWTVPSAALGDGESYAWRARATDDPDTASTQPNRWGAWSDWRHFVVDTTLADDNLDQDCSITGADMQDLAAYAEQEGLNVKTTITENAWQTPFNDLVTLVRDTNPANFAGAELDAVDPTKAYILFKGTSSASPGADALITTFRSGTVAAGKTITVTENTGYSEADLEQLQEAGSATLDEGTSPEMMAVAGYEIAADARSGELNVVIDPVDTVTPDSGWTTAVENEVFAGITAAPDPLGDIADMIDVNVTQGPVNITENAFDASNPRKVIGNGEIENGSGRCTSGFAITDATNGGHFISTAGHCLALLGRNNWKWYRNLASSTPAIALGNAPDNNYVYSKGDAAWFKVSKGVQDNFYYEKTYTKSRDVTAVGLPVTGTKVCYLGSTSAAAPYNENAHCGYVTKFNTTITTTGDNKTVTNLVKFTAKKGRGGDSGAAVFKGNYAVGIYGGTQVDTKGTTTKSDDVVLAGYYTPVQRLYTNLNKVVICNMKDAVYPPKACAKVTLKSDR